MKKKKNEAIEKKDASKSKTVEFLKTYIGERGTYYKGFSYELNGDDLECFKNDYREAE
jgi:hypothetical protein